MKYRLFITIGILLFGIIAILIIPTTKSNSNYQDVAEFGTLKIGEQYAYKAGDEIGHPYRLIPPSRFYVYLHESESKEYFHRCVFEECGDEGGIVAPMKGWLMGETIISSYEEFGIKTNDDGTFITGESSLIVVADYDSKIVGLYSNAKLSDLIDILKRHPHLADFELLKGISQFGSLKVNEQFPHELTDDLEDLTQSDNEEAEFFVYWIWNKPVELGCYYECGAHLWKIGDLGGKLFELRPDDSKILDELGIDASHVTRGELTLIVVTDTNHKILGIYPNAILRDIFGILFQHPEVADFDALEYS